MRVVGLINWIHRPNSVFTVASNSCSSRKKISFNASMSLRGCWRWRWRPSSRPFSFLSLCSRALNEGAEARRCLCHRVVLSSHGAPTSKLPFQEVKTENKQGLNEADLWPRWPPPNRSTPPTKKCSCWVQICICVRSIWLVVCSFFCCCCWGLEMGTGAMGHVVHPHEVHSPCLGRTNLSREEWDSRKWVEWPEDDRLRIKISRDL